MIDRRSMLLYGGAAALGPTAAAAEHGWSEQRVVRFLDRSEQRITRMARRSMRKLFGRRLVSPVPGLQQAIYDAIAGLAGLNLFRRMPVESQVHPAVQEALARHAERHGAGITKLRELLPQAVANTPDLVADNIGARHIMEAVGAEWLGEEMPEEMSARLRRRLGGLAFDVEHRGFQVVADNTMADADRLMRMVDDGSARAVLDARAEASVRVAAARGTARWGSPGRKLSPGAIGGLVFGGGALITGGVILIYLGGLALECLCVGLPLILVGAGCLIGGLALLVRAATGMVQVPRDGQWVARSEPFAAPSRVLVEGNLRIGGRRVPTEGLVGLQADAHAILPGAPVGAVVYRLDDGTQGLVAPGLQFEAAAMPSFALNISHGIEVSGARKLRFS